MSGLSLLPNLFNKQVCLLGKPLTPSNSNSMYYYTGSFLGPGHLLKTELDIKTKELKDLNVSWRHL